MEPEQPKQFSVQSLLNVLRTLKKVDPLFKPLKKLKAALQVIYRDNITKNPSKTVLLYHFGLGSQMDLQLIKRTKFMEYGCQNESPIIPGKAFSYLKFVDQVAAKKYVSQQYKQLVKDYCWHLQIDHINVQKNLIVMYWQGEIQGNEQLQIQDCPSQFDHRRIPGLVLQKDFISKEESQEIITSIDSQKWNKLNNRRVQHYGYQFKYGQNGIDKEHGQTHRMPQWAVKILKKFQQRFPDVFKQNNGDFDQLTVNDYFAGDGIPSHFDTHSPFEQKFIAISLLSGIVMNWCRYDGNQESTYLTANSLMMFSGQARFAWTHGITCRKMDRINGSLVHRSRRVSLTFRKIRFKPCQCKYYFYCDSQGYDQKIMKKNNWLLQKYIHQNRKQKLYSLKAEEIEKHYVEQAYNGFGYNFDNQIIQDIKILLQKQNSQNDFVLDVGCGNSAYRKLLNPRCQYFAVEKCMNMKGELQPQERIFMDCKSLGLKSKIFDKVLLIAVLHHLPSQQARIKCINQCLRVLSEYGSLFISVFSYLKKKHIYSTQDILLDYCLPAHKIKDSSQKETKQKQNPVKNSKGEVYTRYYHLFTIQEISALIEHCGGKIAKFVEDNQNLILQVVK